MLFIRHALSGFVGAGAMASVLLLLGATHGATPSATLDVQRINIREPDGTLRMVLSNTAREPGIVVDGKEQPHPNRRSAGILFYNDEGTENGGLIFDGRRDVGGGRHSAGSLTFDRYKQDQAVQLEATEDGPARHAGLVVNDHPDKEMDFAAIERARALPPAERAEAFAKANVGTTRRLFVGRAADGAAQIVLKDAAGADRLTLNVDAKGGASIRFLDEHGRVVRTIE